MLAKKQERLGEMWTLLMLRTILKKKDSRRDLGKFAVLLNYCLMVVFGNVTICMLNCKTFRGYIFIVYFVLIFRDVSMQKDDELFTVEKKTPKVLIKSARELRKIKAKEAPKCFNSLSNESKVKDPIAKRNIPLLSSDERKHPATMAKIKRNKELGIISDEMKLSLNARIAFGKKIPRAKASTKEFQKDLWSGEDLHAEINKSEWMTRPLRKYHLMNSGTPDVNMPQITHERRTQLRAIDEPMPGISYNPDVKDYDDLINSVVQQGNRLPRID